MGEDGEKTGKKKKETEKATGEGDAAEQDGEKTGKKKKAADYATGEADAAEQDVCDPDAEPEDPFYVLQRSKSLKAKSVVLDVKQDGPKTGKKKKEAEKAR